MTFGEKIKELRLAKELTQEELAAMVGITQGFLGQIERGGRKGHDADLVNKLAAALSVPLDTFATLISPGVTVPPPPAQEHRCQLVGTIAAGPDDVPVVYDEPEWIAFDGPLPNGTFALRVTGHSCTRWGICDGDVVPVAPTTTPMENGFHALRSAGGDHTLKAYARGKWWQFRPGDAEPVEYHFTDSTRLFGLVVDKRYGKRVFSPTATEPVKKPRKKGK